MAITQWFLLESIDGSGSTETVAAMRPVVWPTQMYVLPAAMGSEAGAMLGQTWPRSTGRGVPGPKGTDSLVPGPVGVQGPVGPVGPASTIPGPQGAVGPQGPIGPTGSGTALPLRATISKTTASLASGASEQTTVLMAASYRLHRVSSSVPARVRVYTTTAKRTADLARAIGTVPGGDHGVILEFVATPNFLSADLSPVVDGFDGKATPDGVVPITITNTGTSATVVTVNLEWLRTEG